MACSLWVVNESNTADGGYPQWADGQKVKFMWFDGRDLSDAVKYPANSYEKIVIDEVTLAFEATGAQSML